MLEFEDVTDMNFGYEAYQALTKSMCFFIVAFGTRYQLRIRLHTSPHWETYRPASLEQCKLWAEEWAAKNKRCKYSNTLHFLNTPYSWLNEQSGEYNDNQAYFLTRKNYRGSHINNLEQNNEKI